VKIPIYNILGEEIEKIEKPRIFDIPIRQDIIRRIFHHQFTHRLQPKGRYPLAGRDRSAEYFGVGLGLARIPRYKNQPLRGVGAIVAMARGGRKPHVTTPEKRIYKRINKKELKLAIASAIAATGDRELVKRRGHVIDDVLHIPLITSKDLNEIDKTRELKEILIKLGVWKDIERVRNSVKTVGGKAAWRGRRVKKRVGPLIVYSEDKGIVRAARNIMGIDVVSARDVSIIHLAPGGQAGRLVIWIEDVFPVLEERLKNILIRYSVI